MLKFTLLQSQNLHLMFCPIGLFTETVLRHLMRGNNNYTSLLIKDFLKLRFIKHLTQDFSVKSNVTVFIHYNIRRNQ